MPDTVYLTTTHPSPALVDAAVALTAPPTPTPLAHDGDVEVEPEDAMELIDAPGWTPLPSLVKPLSSRDTQLEPPAPPVTEYPPPPPKHPPPPPPPWWYPFPPK